jgi:hypothetical protein
MQPVAGGRSGSSAAFEECSDRRMNLASAVEKQIVEMRVLWHNRLAFVALVSLSSCTQRLRGSVRSFLCFSAPEVKQRTDGANYPKE